MNETELTNEWTFISSCLTSPDEAPEALDTLSPEMFTDQDCRNAFNGVQSLAATGKSCDVNHLIEILEQRQELNENVSDRLHAAASEFRSAMAPSYYAKSVLEQHRNRQARVACERAGNKIGKGCARSEVLNELDLELQAIRSSDKQSARYKIKGDEFKPFPVNLLPNVLRLFVTESSAAIGCDPTFSLMPALAVCASAIGASRVLQLKHTWHVPSVLWSVVIGESGTQKSPPWRMAIDPLKTRQGQNSELYAAEAAGGRERMREWKREYKAWEHEPKGAPPEEPARLIRERCIVSDTTIEALAPVLRDNPKGVLLARDELSGWISSFDKYSKARQVSSDASQWLEIYNCETISIDRKTGDEPFIHVPRPSVSICGGIQPGMLSRVLTEQFKEDGLESRLLMAFPPRHPRRWCDDEMSRRTMVKYQEMVEKLVELKPDTGSDGTPTPAFLQLSPDAHEMFKMFVDSHGEEQSALHGHQAARWSKLEEIPARLALILHCVRQVTCKVKKHFEVDGATMDAALKMTEWFKSETLRINRLLTEPEEDREARHLIEWIRERGGPISARDLYTCRRDIESSDDAERKLMYLVSIKAGQWKCTNTSRVFVLSDELSAPSP